MINAIVEGGEEMPVRVNNMSASCGPWTVQERGVTQSFALLSHSPSLAWQTLPHQASCDSLPVPALHLHSSGWCHGRFSSWSRALHIWCNVRMYACVFMCVHPSACLAQTSVRGPVVNVALHSFPDDLLHEAKAFGRERHIKQAGEEENSRNMDPVPKLDYCDIFPICFLSLSLFFSTIQICHLVASLHPPCVFTTAFCEYLLSSSSSVFQWGETTSRCPQYL